ncbi:cell death-inducing p53-target protein 1-like [Schistocerca americana]|uniref:cell death-inducing p53-target protein 1-like n=1 Tax=Schistocerca americana TaxID=7009 RepID=UPI001F4F86CE|nr:cell death-inducing p53-target protein 1-like [Schistocerca americana]
MKLKEECSLTEFEFKAKIKIYDNIQESLEAVVRQTGYLMKFKHYFCVQLCRPLRFPVAGAPRDVSDNVTPRRAAPRRRTYHGPPATLGQYCEFRCAAKYARLRITSPAILPALRTSDQNMEPNKSQPPPYGFQAPPTQPPPYTQTPQAQPYGPPPPQPGYVQQHITVVAPLMLGTDPCTTECPACRATIVTRTSSKPSTNTHLLALLLCIFGLWPCVCVPYCAECAYAVDHFCPNCNAYIGQSMA